MSEEALKQLQLQVNNIEILSKAFSEGTATIEYDPVKGVHIVKKTIFDTHTGEGKDASFILPLTAIDSFIDLCDKQQRDAAKAFEGAKAARGYAEQLRSRAKELEQATLPTSLT